MNGDSGKRIERYFHDAGIILDRQEQKRFRVFLEELMKWNKKINLTSVCGVDDIIVYHFLASVPFHQELMSLGEGKNLTIADYGSGGGLPGIPLKILNEGYSVFLIESSQKKTVFLKHICRVLELGDVQVLNERMEKVATSERFHENFDFVVTRGAEKLPGAVEKALPAIKWGGALIAQKGRGYEEEIVEADGALRAKGGRIKKVVRFSVPYHDGEQFLVIAEKCFT